MPTLSRRQTLAAFVGLCCGSQALAETWPSKPIKMVVPFPAGGATDAIARLVAERLGPRLGQAVIIENKPGAATVIGMDMVAKSAADGYTLLVSGASSFTVIPALRTKLPFDMAKAFAPVSLLVNAPLVVLTSSVKPYLKLVDFLAQAKANPKTLTYSTFGAGSAPHLVGEMLAYEAHVDIEPVPYKGSAEALIGVMRGDVDIGVDTLSAASPQIKAGKLRVLAVATGKRSSFLPDSPGMDELNLPHASFAAFYAVAAPAATPSAVLSRLTKEINDIMLQPDVREKCTQLAMEVVAQGPDTLRTVMKSETDKLRELGQRIKISLD
jgi:tripartite-type tricarboxylate transporter receptor subunit TctC